MVNGKGYGRKGLETLFRHLATGTEEYHEKLNEDSQPPHSDLNLGSHECEVAVLITGLRYSVQPSVEGDQVRKMRHACQLWKK
jgi:hypothetical protein